MAQVVMLEVFQVWEGRRALVDRVDSPVQVDLAGLVITMTVQQWRKWIRRVSSELTIRLASYGLRVS